MYYIWHKLLPKHRPYKHARGICISPYVGPYSYCELNYCGRLHIIITFIYIITPLLTSTHKPVLARAPSSVLQLYTRRRHVGLLTVTVGLQSTPVYSIDEIGDHLFTSRRISLTGGLPGRVVDTTPRSNGMKLGSNGTPLGWGFGKFIQTGTAETSLTHEVWLAKLLRGYEGLGKTGQIETVDVDVDVVIYR